MSAEHSTARVGKGWRLRHGHSSNYGTTQVYNAWKNMRRRCRTLKDYAGRGIQFCDRWRSFDNFLADVGEPPGPGMTLDRKDNDGHYEPSNVRWATRKTQQRNRRTNRLITYDGKTKCLAEWCEELGVTFRTMEHRLRRGWSVERAFTQPVQVKRRRGSAP